MPVLLAHVLRQTADYLLWTEGYCPTRHDSRKMEGSFARRINPLTYLMPEIGTIPPPRSQASCSCLGAYGLCKNPHFDCLLSHREKAHRPKTPSLLGGAASRSNGEVSLVLTNGEKQTGGR